MKKSISKNYIYNITYQIVSLLVPLITTPYVAKVLSVDGIGLYSFTYSIAFFFSILAELGSVVYARREVAYYQDDKYERSKVFWELFILRVITTFFCIIVYFIYVSHSEFFILGLAQMIYIISVIFDITWLFQGMEDFKAVVIRNSIIKIIGMIFIFCFVKVETDLLKYILGLAIFPFLGNIICWTILPRYITKVSIKILKPFRHFKDILILFIPVIASQVYLLLDKTMLGIMTVDNIENGYYEQAQKIIKMCWTFLTTFSQVIAPRIVFLYKNDDKQNIREYLRKSFSFIWLLASAICFGIVSISASLIPWFLGDDYHKVIFLLYIFAFIVFPIGLTSIIGNGYLITIKKQKIYTISIIIGAILNFILNCILIPKYYSIGAAISSVLAELIIAVIQIIYVSFVLKEIELKAIFSNSWQYILSGLIMFTILEFISTKITVSIVNTLFLIMIGAGIYFIMLIIMKNEMIEEGKNIIKRKIKGR